VAWPARRFVIGSEVSVQTIANKDGGGARAALPDRYAGKTEPIDLIAGHIPGAINIPFTENLDHNGLFLKPNELKNKYETIFGDIKTENIIVHCGSGVTACHTLLALTYAEMETPKLYVGSWSEWSRNNKQINKTKT
jgi:thiosulfate/3-mercaptopyruvate sulfurtransferase